MAIEDRIDQFVEHFERQIILVSSITSDPRIVVGASDPVIRVALHKKILYSAIIDALAAIRFKGEGLNNTKRFTSMLHLHSGWTACELVSVPVAAERLHGLASPTLKRKLDENLARYNTEEGNSLPLSAFDEPLGQLLEYAEKPKEGSTRPKRRKKLGEREVLAETQHLVLLYKYRNYIVHEFREPGYAMETFADGGDEALYHSYIGPGQKWHLLYPVGLFRTLASNSLRSLATCLREESIDPYERVKNSQDWRP
jgi:hypothetical protein